jgi:hypothetical protein
MGYTFGQPALECLGFAEGWADGQQDETLGTAVSKSVEAAISTFGAAAKAKLASPAITGAPEDQLRGPLESLMRDLAEAAGLPTGSVQLIGETKMADLKTRPDFAVTVHKALIGFIEVKAPGKGADPRRFDDPHDKE